MNRSILNDNMPKFVKPLASFISFTYPFVLQMLLRVQDMSPLAADNAVLMLEVSNVLTVEAGGIEIEIH